ncbi:MAG: alpha/beta hydrolase [Devosia sp.]|uniref:alpha/beta fold hydrolase n=1 Tax=Devosia sp. TaxID=1871048 RepID=UPI001AD38FA2|nr:alpha/beta hydrolase [Devosia sp.]MBN9317742.1 alpha/beta hydrolase [Devosia sp.]
MLQRVRTVPDDYRSFQNLPVTRYAVGPADEMIAVHVSGRLGVDRIPLVCVPGYQRNMSDFADFANHFHRAYGADWPVLLIDLKGRGRSSDRNDKSRYITTVDARDVIQILAALAVDGGIFLGQGYGGQVVMALAAERPNLVAGAVLIDAGPVSDPRGLVRLRNNLKDLDGSRSEAGFRTMSRRMLSPDYPAANEGLLDVLAARTHYLDKRGRVRALFDPYLVKMLEAFEHDDILVPQWPLYDALATAPLMLMRTQLTEQVRRETFEEMLRRRRDSEGYVLEGQGSPALLNTVEDVEPIAEFVRKLLKQRKAA